MILQFSVTNFGSIRAEQTLSLLADADTSLSGNAIDLGLPGMKRERVLKGAVLYGANASGKTNMLLALNHLSELVAESHRYQPNQVISHYQPFLLDQYSRLEPTRYNLSFVSEGARYEYEVLFDAANIWEEELTSYPEGQPRTLFKRVVDRANPKEVAWEPLHSPLREIRSLVLPNMLFLSRAANLNQEEVFPAYQWFTETLNMLNLAVNGGLSPQRTAYILYSEKNEPAKEQPLADDILSLVRQADFGLVDVKIIEKELEFPGLLPVHSISSGTRTPRKHLEAVMRHRGQADGSFELNFDQQSGGTQRFFALAGPWIQFLREGRVLFIDELESSLHPMLVRYLVALFMDPEINTRNAQLIFTTHNPLLLDLKLLRRDQIWFTEKSEEGATTLYPLTEYSPRKDESILRGYLAGRYGGVPFIPHGLLPRPEEAQPAETPIEESQ